MSKLGSLYIQLGEPEGELAGCCETAEWAAGYIESLRQQLASRDAEVAELHNELETERMRNVACGVVAMADTHDSARQARDMHTDYMSTSCSDVARRVDECIKLREQVTLLRDALTLASCCLDANTSDATVRQIEEALDATEPTSIQTDT